MLVPGVQALFVYGTLRSDFPGPLVHQLLKLCGPPRPARAPGRIFDLGHYPGMVESSQADDTVQGEVYELPKAHEALLTMLDEYEDVPGGLYARRVLPATLADGAEVAAYTYIYLKQPVGFHWIPSGDYVAYVRGKVKS